MKLTGDQGGIEALKELKEKNSGYLKFVLNEMRTNTDLCATFKSHDGARKYKATYDPHTGDVNIQQVSS
jgi:hypothetical protein